MLMLAMMLSMNVNAEDEKNYPLFKDATIVNYTEDFSTFKINKATAEFYVEMKLNTSFDKFKRFFVNNLITSANENFKDSQLSLTNNTPSDFEVTIVPTKADNDGEHTIQIFLKQKSSNTLISSFKLNTNGGDDKYFMEELGKGLSKTGKKLAKELISIKKKANTPKN